MTNTVSILSSEHSSDTCSRKSRSSKYRAIRTDRVVCCSVREPIAHIWDSVNNGESAPRNDCHDSRHALFGTATCTKCSTAKQYITSKPLLHFAAALTTQYTHDVAMNSDIMSMRVYQKYPYNITMCMHAYMTQTYRAASANTMRTAISLV